jgi:hypothetical protein
MWRQLKEAGSNLDVIGKKRDTFLRIQIDDFDAKGAEPVDAALESAGFADDDPGKAELADEGRCSTSKEQAR